MILTCPECATGYFVDDAQIKPGGRSVRCAACGARWMAYPDRPLELISSGSEGAVAREAPEPEAPLTAEDLPKVFRARATSERKVREATLAGLVWGAMAVLVVLLVGAAIVFRVAVVRAMPSTAAAYAAIGLPVNRVGLALEQVRYEPSLQDGHAALSVTGKIRNIEDHAIVAPPLRIVLFNADGKQVGGNRVSLSDPRIPPGQSRYFATAILDPPLSAHDMQVDFDLDHPNKTAVTKPVKPMPPMPPTG
ncbi:MAG TPA: MJ0042-type zinc finger domain-containing protein, partial [Caulobacteraceae bacterium]|nr:MJ0042-type zinc finger domain-containing protein [Caulobacteraceae bacterium]